MKALFITREYPPYVYGGAGVHVEYLTKELSKLMDVEVRCFGDQDIKEGPIPAKGYPFEHEMFDDTDKKLKQALMSIRTCLDVTSTTAHR